MSMIRFLSGLNREDALQELEAVGISIPSDHQIRMLTHTSSLYIPPDIPALRQAAKAHNLVGVWLGTEASGYILTNVDSISRWLRQILTTIPDTDVYGAEIESLAEGLEKTSWVFDARGRELRLDRPQIMGVLNVTPDSFSDGGEFFETGKAIDQGLRMLEEGADILDIGGESTRPGAEYISLDEEWKRIEPVIKRLSREDCLISIDTYKAEIARRALNEGAHIVNDISALRFDPEMCAVIGEWDVPAILMHLQGTPRNMQVAPDYDHLMAEITASLAASCKVAEDAGLKKVIVDPGIGFGKRVEDNYEIIRRLSELRILGKPILLGASRKSFIGNLLNVETTRRLPGTIAAHLFGAMTGAHIIRVHDVWEARQSFDVWQAIEQQKA